MARFPYHRSNVRELGRLLAMAALDEKCNSALQANPAERLAEIGLPKQTTELLTFRVVDQNRHPNATALPFKLNAEKLRREDSSYLTGISRNFSLN